LPEPLGPIIPVIDPLLIFNEQSDTAANLQNISKDYLFAEYLNLTA